MALFLVGKGGTGKPLASPGDGATFGVGIKERATNEQARTPAYLSIVAVPATIWNAFGAVDYVMKRTKNEQYLAHFTDPVRVYI